MAAPDTTPDDSVRANDSWLQQTGGWIEHCLRSGLDLVYPPICLVCDAELPSPWPGPLACDACRGQIEQAGEPQCSFCGSPVGEHEAKLDRCVRCRGIRWRLDRIYALGRYRGLRQDAILRVKDYSNEPLALALGQILAERIAGQLAALDLEVVVPVPLFWRRRIDHGGNSAEAIASQVALRLNLPVANDGLIRTRSTEKQSRLSTRQRWENVRGALAVSTAYDWTEARVLLVDDILTTGATANEAAKVLRAAGAAAVFAAVIARGVGEV